MVFHQFAKLAPFLGLRVRSPLSPFLIKMDLEGCSELAKEPVLKTGARKGLWVRVPSPPPFYTKAVE